MNPSDPVQIGTRLEMFVDDAMIEAITGYAALRLHRPAMREIALRTDLPWEGNMCGGYKSTFRDGDLFRMYYQAWNGAYVEKDGKPTMAEAPIRIGYAESRDGVHWTRPSLGLFEFNGSTDNNITFIGFGPETIGVHGFAAMKDSNPACPSDSLYKALGASNVWPYKLYAMKSADGLRWSMLQDEAVITEGAFDSQNVAFWDSERGEYRAYLRDFSGDFFRGIKTCTSRDFLNWTKPEWLEFPGAPAEQLYTNQVIPYFRAPHLFVGFPARYIERKWSPTIEALPELEHRKFRAAISERYGAAITDGQFMASRDGRIFKRWDEAFIRPGLRPTGSWTYGDCYQGWGLIETASDIAGAPDELSMFVAEGYWRGKGNAIRRYSLRMDGFVSLHAPLAGGALTTVPLTFAGDDLLLNISTSAGGSAAVELQSPDGRPIDGFALADCIPIIGDDLAFPVRWRGGNVGALAGQSVRIRFVINDADLYSFRFAAR
jgi:hypothetical protein